MGQPLYRVSRVPTPDSRIIITLCLVPSYSLEGSVPGENHCLLSVHDIPSIELVTPPTKGTCLNTVQHPISLGTSVPHDVVAWYRLTVFCQPTSGVGNQMG
jgi:hypothetical protein